MTLLTEPFERLVYKIDHQAKLLRVWPLLGGVSAQVVAFEIERADGAAQKMILRRHGDGDYYENMNIAADEFRLLTLLHAEGLPTPIPYYLDDRAEIFERPSLVMEFIDGVTEFEPADVTDFLRQLATQLVRIHHVEGVTSRLAFLPKLAEIAWRKLGNRPDRLDDSIREGHIRDVLEAGWPFPNQNLPVLLHGDYWLGNVLWRDGQLVGIVDWEDARIGDPLEELGKTRLELLWSLGAEAMNQFVVEYAALMPHVDFNNQPYWDLYVALKTAFRLGEWAESEAQEKRMREQVNWFVDQAFERLGLR